MEFISHYFGVCERTGEGLLQEPLNLLSNLLFIFVAYKLHRYYRRHPDLRGFWLWDVHAMVALVFLIGVCSIIFHAYPTPVTELVDTVPIATFIILFFFSALFRIGRCNMFEAAICFAAFTGTTAALVYTFPRALNDSIGYLSSMIALMMIALYLNLKARPSAQRFLVASLIGNISLFFRATDHAVCEGFPIGTHFLWHSCNALLIYILVKQIIRNVNREARLRRRGIPLTWRMS